jgi:hypothetical protein
MGPPSAPYPPQKRGGRYPRMLVALAPVRDLLLCAKHLFFAAMGPLLGRALMVRGRLAGA